MSGSEPLDPDLLERLRASLRSSRAIATLSNGRPNWVTGIDRSGVHVETEASRKKGAGPQLVEAWMLNVAWRHLQATGSLTNKYLLATDGLNVKRSSAVCALLATLPGVDVASSRPIELRFGRDLQV